MILRLIVYTIAVSLVFDPSLAIAIDGFILRAVQMYMYSNDLCIINFQQLLLCNIIIKKFNENIMNFFFGNVIN